jgi:hypothetical protein
MFVSNVHHIECSIKNQKGLLYRIFNSILLLSIKTPITEHDNHMKKLYIKKRDIMISMIIKLTCNDKNL